MPSPEPHRFGAGRYVWPAQLAVLVLAALYALYFHARLPSRLPSEDDFQKVAQALKQDARPDDGVLLFPWWTERARMFVPEGLDVVGYLGSDQDPLRRHPRIWVLSQPDLPKNDEASFERDFLPQRTRVGEPRRFGKLELTLYQNGRYKPFLYSAPDALLSGQAYLERADGQRAACARMGDAFRCPGGAHLYLRTEWHEVFYEPRRCIYMHAPGGDTKMVLELPSVPLSGDGLFEAGYVWEHAVKKDGFTTTYVALEDAANGEKLADLVLPAGKEGFQRATVLTRGAQPKNLRITAQSQNPDSRVLCVDLSVFDAAGGGS